MSPNHEGIFIISVVLHVICVIPNTSPSASHIHHSALREENSHRTNRDLIYTQSYDGNTHPSDDSNSRPYFLKVPKTVSVIEGSSVILSCRIETLGDDRMVFWIRNYDLQILTAGLATFTADTRFQVNHENSVDATDWSLLITYVKKEDQGGYECQVNTEPAMKLNINLLVKELAEVMEMDSPFSGAMIEGKNSNVLKKGSTITLTCKVVEDESGENARRIDWMKNGELVNVQTRNGGVSIDTVWFAKTGTSKLTLGILQDDDSGNYSCTSNGVESEEVSLRVVPNPKGDAAEISAKNIGSTRKSSILITLLFYLVNFNFVS